MLENGETASNYVKIETPFYSSSLKQDYQSGQTPLFNSTIILFLQCILAVVNNIVNTSFGAAVLKCQSSIFL